jgi:hypothetical protein
VIAHLVGVPVDEALFLPLMSGARAGTALLLARA